jgi:hypothetical protein
MREDVSCRRLKLRRDSPLDRFDFRFELEPEIGAAPLDDEPLVFSRPA